MVCINNINPNDRGWLKKIKIKEIEKHIIIKKFMIPRNSLLKY